MTNIHVCMNLLQEALTEAHPFNQPRQKETPRALGATKFVPVRGEDLSLRLNMVVGITAAGKATLRMTTMCVYTGSVANRWRKTTFPCKSKQPEIGILYVL